MKEFQIGVSHAGTTAPDLELQKFTLKSLGAAIMQHKPGPKFGAYFVRGEADYRNDDSLKDIQLIIIDGDSSLNDSKSAPDPKSTHEALKQMGYNHLIYPSFSNSEGKTRWRAVIPCTGIESKEQLHTATNDITARLQQADVKINPVRENYVLSQAWYITKPSEGAHHDWNLLHDTAANYAINGNPLTDPQQIVWDHAGIPHPTKAGNSHKIQTIDPDSAISNISAGVAIHPSLVALGGSLTSKGFESEAVCSVLKSMMLNSKACQDRPGRMDNIDNEVEGILAWIGERRGSETPETKCAPVSIKELWNMEPLPRQWLINGILTKSAVNITSGEGGIGKSNMSLLIALSCASGFPIEPFTPPNPVKTLIINAEDPEDEIHRRIWALKKKGAGSLFTKKHLKCLHENLIIYPGRGAIGPLMEMVDGNPRVSGHGLWLKSVIEEQKPALVFLDTKSRLYGLNENDNDHAAQWISFLESLAEDFQTSFIVLAHTGKSNQNNMKSGYASRGASAISDNARSGMSLAKLTDDESEVFGVSADDYFKLTVTKANYSSYAGKVWYFLRGDEGIPTLVDLETEKLKGPAAAIFKYLEMEDVSKRDFKGGCKQFKELMKAEHRMGANDILRLIDRLIKKGDLFEAEIDSGGRRKKKVLKVTFK